MQVLSVTTENINHQIQNTWKVVEEFLEGLLPGINENDAQPGGGKTFQFIKRSEKYPDKRFGFFSSNHDHLSRVETDLKNKNIPNVHWEGFARKCPRYPKPQNKGMWTPDEKLVYDAYNTFVNGARFLCATCNKKGCPYKQQFEKRDRVVLAPLEFLFHKGIEERFDEIWIDESVKKITCFNWDFSTPRFTKFMHTLGQIKAKRIPLMRKCRELFGRLHKELLKQTSIIFTRPPDELITFSSDSYYGEKWVEKGFLQNKDRVTHFAEIDLACILLKKFKKTEKYYFFDAKARTIVIWAIISAIRKAIQDNKVADIQIT